MKTQLSVKLDPLHLAHLRERAKQDDRTLAYIIRKLIQADMEKKK